MLTWIAQYHRCVRFALMVGGGATLLALTAPPFNGELDDVDIHKISVPPFALSSGTVTASGSVSGSGVGVYVGGVYHAISLDGAIGDTISEQEFRLQPYTTPLMHQPRPVDPISLYSFSETIGLGIVAFGFEWPALPPETS